MTALILRLLTLSGDELGRLPLFEVQIPQAGASGTTPIRPHLTEQMETLYSRIVRAVEGEQMAIALSPIEMQVAVSRVLLSCADAEEVVIDLPVRGVLPSPNPPESPEPARIPTPTATWSDLWEVEESK